MLANYPRNPAFTISGLADYIDLFPALLMQFNYPVAGFDLDAHIFWVRQQNKWVAFLRFGVKEVLESQEIKIEH